MFFEKWFDKGDLVLFEKKDRFATFDEDGNASQNIFGGEPKISMFMNYPDPNTFDACEIYIFSDGIIEIVSQSEISILSKSK